MYLNPIIDVKRILIRLVHQAAGMKARHKARAKLVCYRRAIDKFNQNVKL